MKFQLCNILPQIRKIRHAKFDAFPLDFPRRRDWLKKANFYDF
jgi:hypothetical protein